MDKRRSIVLNMTLVAALIIGVCCFIGDVFGYLICEYAWADNFFGGRNVIGLIPDDLCFKLFVGIYYMCTFLTYGILFGVIKLLMNMKKDIVFDRSNTKMMKLIAGCSFGICLLCTAGVFVTVPLVLIAIVGLFVGLIVLCVGIVMAKAIDMRSELDLTI